MLHRAVGIVGALPRPAVARTVPSVTPIEAVAAIAALATAVVAVTIALGAAHHGGRAFLVRVDPDREIAQNILVETFQPLDLIDRRWRSVDIHEREMRLAVLAQTIGEGFHAPVFSLFDRSAKAFDDALQLRG